METGIIRTGADPDRIAAPFQPVHHAAVSAVRSHAPSAALYAYGSVVTGQAIVGASDVDLLTIGLPTTDAKVIGLQLSALFADVCRGVEISAAKSGDFVGESDESFGNRVFLRHYCVLLDGPDVHRPEHEFTGDRRVARGFNGDIGQHARRWRTALDAGGDPAQLARRVARKSLLAVAGLVSVHDHTWTTDRETSAARWAEIAPEHRVGLALLTSWVSTTSPAPPTEVIRGELDGTVEAIVSTFGEMIGLWPDDHRERPR